MVKNSPYSHTNSIQMVRGDVSTTLFCRFFFFVKKHIFPFTIKHGWYIRLVDDFKMLCIEHVYDK